MGEKAWDFSGLDVLGPPPRTGSSLAFGHKGLLVRTRWDMANGNPKDEKTSGLEGAADDQAGIIRESEAVEGGEDLSIGGGPPSAAGGTRKSPAPTREDLRDDPSE